MGDEELETILAGVKDASLRHTLQFGIGLHHAGLNDKDRSLCEKLFVSHKIQVRHRGDAWVRGLGEGPEPASQGTAFAS